MASKPKERKNRRMRKSSLKFDGLETLQDKLKNLPKTLREKAAREATRRAVDAVLKEAKANLHHAPKAYGVTLKSQGKTITRQPGELAEALTMQKVSKGESPSYLSMHRTVFLRNVNNGIGNIAHFLEYGVSKHQITRNGKEYTHPGHENFAFLRPAARKTKPLMYRLMKETMTDGIKDALDLKK